MLWGIEKKLFVEKNYSVASDNLGGALPVKHIAGNSAADTEQ
jgi:hypothetical protein